MIDLPLSAWFHAHSHPLVTQLMLAITHWHSTMGVLLMVLVLGLALYFAGRPWWLLSLVLSVGGGMLLNVAVKHLVQRARPYFDQPVLELTSYSFPSGHTAQATLFYGFLAAFLLSHAQARRWRGGIVAAAVTMVLLVGLSRIYLGAHYFTDVVAAMVEGLLWLGVCLGGVQALWRRRTGGAA